MATQPEAMIALHGAGFEYVTNGRRFRAVEQISLAVPRGACVAFVGPSGCGKSTLLKLISGLVRATEGTVQVDGRPVVAPLKIVGMAFQNPSLLPWRTVLGNVLLPLEVLKENGDARAADRQANHERALALLEKVGLAGVEHKQPRELSGGMRQRVSLCRALVHEPELMLLDEPFAALDAFTREEMWEFHQTLRQLRTFTAVLVTHDLREAVFLAETIYVMSSNPGRIAHRHAVTQPFPRTLEHLYGHEATELIRIMREQIRSGQGSSA